MIQKANSQSWNLTGDTTYDMPADQNRSSFFLTVETGSCTVKYGDGDGVIPVAEGGYLEPRTVPTGKIQIVAASGSDVIILATTSAKPVGS